MFSKAFLHHYNQIHHPLTASGTGTKPRSTAYTVLLAPSVLTTTKTSAAAAAAATNKSIVTFGRSTIGFAQAIGAIAKVAGIVGGASIGVVVLVNTATMSISSNNKQSSSTSNGNKEENNKLMLSTTTDDETKKHLSFNSLSKYVDWEFLKSQVSTAQTQTGFQVSKSFVAGGIAGAVAKTVVAPLERTKIIFQTSVHKFSLHELGLELAHILKSEGVLALWKGHAASLARVVPYSAIQLTTYDQVKYYLLEPGQKDLAPIYRILGGSVAGGVSVLATYPLDLVRARLAVQRETNIARGIRNSFKVTLQNEGILGLYKGLLPTMLGIVPYAGIAFGTFETLKLFVSSRKLNKDDKITTTERVICGGLSGLIAQSITYPVDVIRRRMQTDGYALEDHTIPTSRPAQKRYGSILGTAQYVYQTEGIRGFFKGVTLNWVKGPISVGVSFTVYDVMKNFLGIER